VKVRLPVYKSIVFAALRATRSVQTADFWERSAVTLTAFGVVCLFGVFIARLCRALADLHVNGEEAREASPPRTARRFRYAL
jgi:hypothetical protein